MKVLPIGTIPLRASLALARAANARHLRRSAMIAPVPMIDWSPPSNLVAVCSRIDPYPDLGHQLSTWIAGYLWAADLGVPFVGGPVSKDRRGLFRFEAIGVRQDGLPSPVRTRRVGATGFETEVHSLPYLQEQIRRAARAAKGPFVAQLALDQRRWDQTPAASALRQAFLAGYLGENLMAAEVSSDYVAMHARRGDIGRDTHPNRWVGVEFYRGLVNDLRKIDALAEAPIRLYTSGNAEDLLALQDIGVEIRKDGDRDRDLLELAAAKLLVTGPSSFGFTAALISKAPVIARYPWWHATPDSGRWARCAEGVPLEVRRISELLLKGAG